MNLIGRSDTQLFVNKFGVFVAIDVNNTKEYIDSKFHELPWFVDEQAARTMYSGLK